jgi:dihydropyrimidinase
MLPLGSNTLFCPRYRRSEYRGTISAKTHQMNVDYNSFEGFPIEGRPHVVTVREKAAARDGVFVGEFGRGKLLERESSHF